MCSTWPVGRSSYVTKLVTNEQTDFDATVHGARARNDQLLGSGGQRSRSHEAEIDLEVWRRHRSRPPSLSQTGFPFTFSLIPLSRYSIPTWTGESHSCGGRGIT